jgi:hypothetical protein
VAGLCLNRFRRVVMTTLGALIVIAVCPAGSADAAAPGVTLEGVSYHADGAVLRVHGSVTCPAEPFAPSGSVELAQNVGNGLMQRRVVSFETPCDGTPHRVDVGVPAFGEQQSDSGRPWRPGPVAVSMDLFTVEGGQLSDHRIMTIGAPDATDELTAAAAVRGGGLALHVRFSFACREEDPPFLDVLVAQRAAAGLVQGDVAAVTPTCDGAEHRYDVFLRPQFAVWGSSPVFVRLTIGRIEPANETLYATTPVSGRLRAPPAGPVNLRKFSLSRQANGAGLFVGVEARCAPREGFASVGMRVTQSTPTGMLNSFAGIGTECDGKWHAERVDLLVGDSQLDRRTIFPAWRTGPASITALATTFPETGTPLEFTSQRVVNVADGPPFTLPRSPSDNFQLQGTGTLGAGGAHLVLTVNLNCPAGEHKIVDVFAWQIRSAGTVQIGRLRQAVPCAEATRLAISSGSDWAWRGGTAFVSGFTPFEFVGGVTREIRVGGTAPPESSGGPIEIEPVANLQADGAGIVASAIVRCPAGTDRPELTAHVTQRVERDRSTFSSGSRTDISCDGVSHLVPVATHPENKSTSAMLNRPHVPGPAGVRFELDSFCCTGRMVAVRDVELKPRAAGPDPMIAPRAQLLADGSGIAVTFGNGCATTGPHRALVFLALSARVAGGLVQTGSRNVDVRCDGPGEVATVIPPFLAPWQRGPAWVTARVREDCETPCPEILHYAPVTVQSARISPPQGVPGARITVDRRAQLKARGGAVVVTGTVECSAPDLVQLSGIFSQRTAQTSARSHSSPSFNVACERARSHFRIPITTPGTSEADVIRGPWRSGLGAVELVGYTGSGQPLPPTIAEVEAVPDETTLSRPEIAIDDRGDALAAGAELSLGISCSAGQDIGVEIDVSQAIGERTTTSSASLTCPASGRATAAIPARDLAWSAGPAFAIARATLCSLSDCRDVLVYRTIAVTG